MSRHPRPRPRRRLGAVNRPQSIELERFDLAAVTGAKNYARATARFYWDHYASLAQQRAEKRDEITKSLIGAAEGPFDFSGWQRIVDYRYSFHPLSTVGSVITDPGGRFNVGDIDRARFSPFHALYLAADRSTAILEKFGEDDPENRLSNLDFALRSETSFSCVSVTGHLDAVLDLRHADRLGPLVEIIKRFKLPPDLPGRARQLRISFPKIVTTVSELIHVLLSPKWRIEPMQVDIAAASQIFGQLVWTAGLEGIVFPSSKADGACLAIFPDNLSPSSFVELDDEAPSAVTHRRLDRTNYRDFI